MTLGIIANDGSGVAGTLAVLYSRSTMQALPCLFLTGQEAADFLKAIDDDEDHFEKLEPFDQQLTVDAWRESIAEKATLACPAARASR